MITLEQFKEQDLCFVYNGQIYDYSTLEELYKPVFSLTIKLWNVYGHEDMYKDILEQYTNIQVYTKKYSKFSIQEARNLITEAIIDNHIFYSNLAPYFSKESQKLLGQLVKQLQAENNIYTTDKKVDFINLKDEIDKYVKERLC
jgi:hypothetical protein